MKELTKTDRDKVTKQYIKRRKSSSNIDGEDRRLNLTSYWMCTREDDVGIESDRNSKGCADASVHSHLM